MSKDTAANTALAILLLIILAMQLARELYIERNKPQPNHPPATFDPKLVQD